MKPRRAILLLNTVLIMAMLVLTACSPKTATPEVLPATDVPATKAPEVAQPTKVVAPAAEGEVPEVLSMPEQIAGGRAVEITVVGRPPDSQPSLLAAWEEQVTRFQTMYPNVTIVGSDYAYSPDLFAALVAGNQVPTLFQVYMTDPTKMIEQGVAADLTSFYEAQNLAGVYNPQVMSLVTKDGKIYGVPIKAYAMGLAYNIQMLKDAGFDAPPTTWDELALMAEKMTDRDNGIAGLSMITDGSAATGWHATTFAYNFGLKNTDIVTLKDGKYTAGFGEGPLVSALNFLKDLRWKYDVLPRENLGWPTNGEALATGRAAMVIMAGDQFTWIRQTYTDVDMSQFGFAPLPAGANGQSVSLIGGDVAMVNASATSDQIEAAAYYRMWERMDANEIKIRFEQGKADPTQVVGAPQLPMFTGDYQTATAALEKQYANLPVDNYKLFMDAIVSGATSIMPEPLVAGQEYYAALGTVVSQIVADETADPAKLAKEAAATFQTNVLDMLAPASGAPVGSDVPADGEVPVVLHMPEQIAGGRAVEITVVGRPPDSQPSLLAAWEEQVTRFQTMYPNVTIVGSDYAYSPDLFAALVAGNQVPTLFQVYMTDPTKMIEQGVAADLTSFYEAQNLAGVYNPQVMSLVTKDGKIYGVPIKAYAMGLAYNIQMLKDAGFDAPPTTWDELALMAEKMTDRDNGIAGLSMITDGSAATGWHATTFAYNFGLKNTDIATLKDGKFTAGFGSDAMVNAMNFLKDLRWKYDVLPRENLGWPTNGEALATGRAAMVIMAGDQFTWIRQTYTDVDMSQFGFAPLPAGANGQSVSLIGGDVAMVNASATPDQIEAAAYYRMWERMDANEIKTRFEQGKADPTQVVGAPQLPMFTGDYQTATAALEKQYANLPVDNYKLFMDAIVSGATSIMPEPLVAGQEYYAALGTVVSQIMADENADPAALIKAAVETFQANVLDLLK